MKYTKPEVAVLGEAVRVIENSVIKTPKLVFDNSPHTTKGPQPAYDLDE